MGQEKTTMEKYHKPHGHGAFTPQDIKNLTGNSAQLQDGRWIQARPEPYRSFLERLCQAWHVLTYKADALYWG